MLSVVLSMSVMSIMCASQIVVEVSRASDICSRVMDPDTALGHSLGLDNTLIPVNSTDMANQLVTGSNIALRHQHGHTLWLRPWGSTKSWQQNGPGHL